MVVGSAVVVVVVTSGVVVVIGSSGVVTSVTGAHPTTNRSLTSNGDRVRTE